MDDKLVRLSDVLSFQNEVEPMMCKSPITGDVFSATKDTDLVAYFASIPAVDAVELKHKYSETGDVISQAVKELVYSRKDEIIDMVVERATREIVRKGLPKLIALREEADNANPD